MTPTPALPSSGFLTALRVAGPDARTFLQGQLSADVAGLAAGHAVLASLNSPQGRVQAVPTLVGGTDEVLMVMPTELAAAVTDRLRKYVLRSKVTLGGPDGWQQVCMADREALLAAGLPRPGQPGRSLEAGGLIVVRWHEPGGGAAERYLVTGRGARTATDPVSPDDDAAWRLADIRAGLPSVRAATREAFVAQMLNLDLLGGISFTKGCYTGQEIIARTQYRGAIKRRMFRFAAACPPPPPGTRVLAGDTHAGDVVDAVGTAAGCELLAVVSLAQRDATLALATAPEAPLQRLPLPYATGEEDGPD